MSTEAICGAHRLHVRAPRRPWRACLALRVAANAGAGVDSTQYNVFTIAPKEAVYNRLPLAHTLNLFDINRSCGDVPAVEEALTCLAGVDAAAKQQRSGDLP